MACSNFTLYPIEGVCDTSKGGIVKVWIAAFDDIKGKPVLDETEAGHKKIKTVTLETSANGFKGFSFRKNTGSMTSTLNVDAANGTQFVSTELVLSFTRMEAEKRLAIQGLCIGEVAVIVLDSNGVYWYLGYDEAVAATTATGQTGQQKTDGNFYSITLGDESGEFPYEVSQEAITALGLE